MSEISVQIATLSPYFEIKLPYNLFVIQGNETQLSNWQKESWQTFEETSRHVRLERVYKWPNSMIDI
jgi:hypothetical protein